VPALPSSVLEPLWVQVAALPTRQVSHPLGCHRPPIADRIVFDKLIQVLVFGCGYRRIADATCSATTLRRRRDEWISAGVAEQLRLAVLAAYDQLFGLEPGPGGGGQLHHKAPCGGQVPAQVLPTGASRASTLGRRRGRWHAAGRGGCPGQPPRRRAAGGDLGCPRRGCLAARPALGAPGRRLRLPAVSAGVGRSGHGR
jgi:transposase